MSDKRFEKGQYVVYGTNGICLVEDIKRMSFTRGMAEADYYVLNPGTNNDSTIFVPLDNEILLSKMRALMTKEEIDSLLLGTKGKEIKWNTDRRLRTEAFHEILMQGVTEELLLMISCIYLRKRELINENKKLPITDSNTLKAAEQLVEEEFSHVLGINAGEVGKYIRNLLGVTEDVMPPQSIEPERL